jgi:hypothetical protein
MTVYSSDSTHRDSAWRGAMPPAPTPPGRQASPSEWQRTHARRLEVRGDECVAAGDIPRHAPRLHQQLDAGHADDGFHGLPPRARPGIPAPSALLDGRAAVPWPVPRPTPPPLRPWTLPSGRATRTRPDTDRAAPRWSALEMPGLAVCDSSRLETVGQVYLGELASTRRINHLVHHRRADPRRRPARPAFSSRHC